MKPVTFIILLIIIMTGCSQQQELLMPNDELMNEIVENINKETIIVEYLEDIDLEELRKLKINLWFSPDSKYFLQEDIYTKVYQLYLYQISNEEGKLIYDFHEFWGEVEDYPKTITTFFWDANAENIYLHKLQGSELFKYSIINGEWEKVEHSIPLRNNSVILMLEENVLLVYGDNEDLTKSGNGTCIPMGEEGSYYTYNMITHELIPLPQLSQLSIEKATKDKLLVWSYDEGYNIFDIKSKILTKLEHPIISDDSRSISLYPNYPNTVTFLKLEGARATNQYTDLYLLNYETGDYEKVLIGEGSFDNHGWNHEGTAFLSQAQRVIYPNMDIINEFINRQ